MNTLASCPEFSTRTRLRACVLVPILQRSCERTRCHTCSPSFYLSFSLPRTRASTLFDPYDAHANNTCASPACSSSTHPPVSFLSSAWIVRPIKRDFLQITRALYQRTDKYMYVYIERCINRSSLTARVTIEEKLQRVKRVGAARSSVVILVAGDSTEQKICID